DGQAVLGDRKGASPSGSPTPAQGAGKTRGEVAVGPGLRIGIEEIEPASGLQQHEGAGVSARGIGGRIEQGHGRAPVVSDRARRTSFQSPPSIGGESRANGILNFSARDRWRSAKRSPGPLASAALQRSAPGSIAILA